MVEPVSVIIGSTLFFFLIKVIIINQIISRISNFVFSPLVIRSAIILLILYLIFPEEVLPYYVLVWNFVIDSLVSLLSILWDFLYKILVDSGTLPESA